MCSNQKMSCVRIRRSLVFESRDFLCSSQKISCVPITTSRVFQSRHVLCSNHEMSCVPIKTFPRSKTTPFPQIRHATFDRILAIVPGFFRFVTQKGRILGRSPKFAQKWRVKFWVRKKVSEMCFFDFFFQIFFSNFFLNFCCRAVAAPPPLRPRCRRAAAAARPRRDRAEPALQTRRYSDMPFP